MGRVVRYLRLLCRNFTGMGIYDFQMELLTWEVCIKTSSIYG